MSDSIIAAADRVDSEFGLLLRALLYCGLRLGEVLAWEWSDLQLDEGAAWTRREKGGIEFRRAVARRPLSLRYVRTGPQMATGACFASTRAEIFNTC